MDGADTNGCYRDRDDVRTDVINAILIGIMARASEVQVPQAGCVSDIYSVMEDDIRALPVQVIPN
jgi:hypothetical protein